ncbi:hypothetical protein [Marinigracilibium pacificum]|uniref:MORN repeat protein n=1 Tax=Marinigracilibium pacificum TaxID=2729599 RepID=A0A848ITH5_9BACT|nr:hypothetical protein [Marinigracilibium pacificum]NMM47647.1 hypothetical protein [Marinigracilibium pacificum]
MTTIKDNNAELEYRREEDLFVEVYFKGLPFTGKIISSYPPIEQTSYVNGNAHGDYIVKYKDGIIREHEIYDNGRFVKGFGFYPNGNKMMESTPSYYRYWNLNGAIVSRFQDGKHYEYYSSGELKSFSDKSNTEPWQTKYYLKSGEVIYTQMKDKMVNGTTERLIEYDNELMLNNYFNLLSFENPELKNESISHVENHRIHHIWMWFWEVFEMDQRKYFDILNSLMVHSDGEIIKRVASIISIHRFHSYIQPENKENSKAYHFIREYTKYQNENFPDRETKRVIL